MSALITILAAAAGGAVGAVSSPIVAARLRKTERHSDLKVEPYRRLLEASHQLVNEAMEADRDDEESLLAWLRHVQTYTVAVAECDWVS